MGCLSSTSALRTRPCCKKLAQFPSIINLSSLQTCFISFIVITVLTKILNYLEIKCVCLSPQPGDELADGSDHVFFTLCK